MRHGRVTVASEKDDQMSEPLINHRDLRNPLLCPIISVDSDPRRENPPHLLQTPEPISGWHRHTSVTPVIPVNS